MPEMEEEKSATPEAVEACPEVDMALTTSGNAVPANEYLEDIPLVDSAKAPEEGGITMSLEEQHEEKREAIITPCRAERQREVGPRTPWRPLPPRIPDHFLRFTGRVVEVDANHDSAGAAFDELFSRSRFEAAFPDAAAQCLPRLVGVDFEWRPDRARPSSGNNSSPGNPIALVQLACWDAVLLIRTIGCRRMPEWLAEFLEDSSIVKVSASFDVCDKQKLKHTFGWDFEEKVKDVSSYIDIAELAKERGVPHGMMKMAVALGAPLLKSKEFGQSDWATEGELSAGQKAYAADDAFFTLYLLGKLCEREPSTGSTPGSSAESRLSKASASWLLISSSMQKLLEAVDNRVYKECFFQLRDVVKDAVVALSNALGSAGHASFSSIFKVHEVEKMLSSIGKRCKLTLSAGFLRQNEDLFSIFRRDNEIKVRMRQCDSDDQYNADSEEDSVFLNRVVDLLVAYRPPDEKDRTLVNRAVPEATPIPARAIMTSNERRRWEECSTKFSETIQTTQTSTDGTVLKLLRHPRGPDRDEHLAKCAKTLQDAVGIEAKEAQERLKVDEKFVQFWEAMALLQKGSVEEVNTARTLRARTRILIDSHRLAAKVSASWEQAREGLEQVKWYRRLLGAVLGDEKRSEGNEAEDEQVSADHDPQSEIAECLNAIAEVWPDVQSIAQPSRSQLKRARARAWQDGPDAKRAKGDKGKGGKGGGKGKGKTGGKGKSKGKGG